MAEPERLPLRDVRCGCCARLLFKAEAVGRIEVVCPNCKQYHKLVVRNVPARR